MADKRMFSQKIIDSDAFLDMPTSAQALYFHLGMRADDDGFVNNPKKIRTFVGAADDDLKLLIAKNFLIPFESGVVVIKHWRIHNYIQKDRYTPTAYTEELAQLEVKENKAYTLVSSLDTACIQNGHKVDAQNRLDKNRVDQSRIVKKEEEEESYSITTDRREWVRECWRKYFGWSANPATLDRLEAVTEANPLPAEILDECIRRAARRNANDPLAYCESLIREETDRERDRKGAGGAA